MAIPESIKQKANKIRNEVYGKDVREALASGIEKAGDIADKANTKSNDAVEQVDNIQEQVNQLVVEGDSSVEAAQARVDAEGKSYPTLKARLDEKETEFSSQLAQTEDEIFHNSISATRKMKLIATIVDDDIFKPVLTKLKPTAEKYNIPITLAAITSNVDEDDFTLTSQELIDLHESGLFEIVSHTHTHPYLAEITEEEVEYELKTSKEWLRDRGYNSNVFVYPYGSLNESVKDIVSQYYKIAIDVDIQHPDAGLNFSPIDSMQLKRVYVERGVQRVKDQLLRATQSENGAWVIIGTHCYNDDFHPEDLEEIIEYAHNLGFEFVTTKEGIRTYGNLLEAGKGGSLMTNGVVIGADGKVSGKIGAIEYSHDPIHADDPITNFKRRSITLRYYNNPQANDNNMPVPNAGLLEVYRTGSGADGTQFSHQLYRVFETGDVYERKWDQSNSQWQSWTKVNKGIQETSEWHPVTSLFVDYANYGKNYVLVNKVSSENATGYPEDSAGMVYTYPFGFHGFAYQEYHIQNSNKVYRRYTKNDGTWSEFDEVSSVIKRIQNHSITANSPISDFENGKISKHRISDSEASGFPENRSGILTTNRLFWDHYAFQTYEVAKSHNVYRRWWNTDNTSWSDWKQYQFV